MKRNILKGLAVTVMAATVALAAGGAIAAGKISGKTERMVRSDFVDALNGKTVAFVPISLGLPLSDFWDAGIRDAATAIGMNYVVKDPAWNMNAMSQAISALISEKVDYLVVQNPDVQVFAKLFRKAEQNGTHVIQLNMASNYRSSGFVGVDWVSHGQEVGDDIVKQCAAKGGKVAIVQGELTAAANVWFNVGLMKAFKASGKINVVNDQAAQWDATKAHDITAAVLQQHPDLCATVGVWGIMMMGSGQAIKEAGKTGEVLVYGSGSNSRPVCDSLQTGILDKHYGYDSYLQGRDVVNAIQAMAQMKVEPGERPFALYTPIDVLAKETVAKDDCRDLMGKK
ncbi:MAG: sugar ABC transporter substrate-binding protein [Rhodospirillaceae bacterium]|nr:sugar ABC transporter substrate-binding protein [Rhodospirillaceae bacterium]MBT4045656.1 sugar ABC transporter substrate-binding protein [Rhodospirillaceae bacterium]MBT4689921.1 sugar ABC transporter substrate-binding protein [Rhodospirillaceae bacterium]MBT5081970.1 sugar ABC transporter substrate-binding protein [Rhodospirillaceae bacterium]MBT5881137.1 sugar ABC transporter substrate-binding protein [Rhodospirillaceae bacterium]